MNDLARDLRFALRTLAKQPMFLAVAVITLAIGIGANTAIFSIVNKVLLHPLPAIESPSRVMTVFRAYRQAGQAEELHGTSYPNYLDLARQTSSFSHLGASAFSWFNLATGGEPEQLPGQCVNADFFATFGLEPVLGRFFTEEETRPPGHSVVVLSHALWQRRFGGDPELVGRPIRINGRAFDVVGIAPEGFRGVQATFPYDLWVPSGMYDTLNPRQEARVLEHRGYRFFTLHGRLASDVTRDQAQAEADAVAGRLATAYPRWNENRGFALRPVAESTIDPRERPIYLRAGTAMMIAVGLVLLIACTTVANLLLSRAGKRRKEIALRLALGASRGRLVRQLLTETLTLAAMGGLLGAGVAVGVRKALVALRPPDVPAGALVFGLDLRVLLFSFAATAFCGVLIGLAPALASARLDLVSALKEAIGGKRRLGARQALVVAQIALSMVSLIAASFFVFSWRNALDIDPGFEREKLTITTFDVGAQGYERTRGLSFFDRLRSEAAALPGVRTASLARSRPLGNSFSYRMFVDGREDVTGPDGTYLPFNSVTPGYFETLGLRMIEGRTFGDQDRSDSAQVAIVNQALVERFWPGESVVGRHLRFAGGGEPWTIVGVVEDMDYNRVGETRAPYFYRPITQEYSGFVSLLIRTEGAPQAILPMARALIADLDAELPIRETMPVTALLRQALWAAATGAWLFGLFGVVALTLAAIGLYGVLGQSVHERRRELGLRMALGAQRRQIAYLVLRQGLGAIAVGAVVGSVLAYAASRGLSGILYGLGSFDPRPLVLAAGVLIMAGVLACLVPARDATRTDLVTTLKGE